MQNSFNIIFDKNTLNKNNTNYISNKNIHLIDLKTNISNLFSETYYSKPKLLRLDAMKNINTRKLVYTTNNTNTLLDTEFINNINSINSNYIDLNSKLFTNITNMTLKDQNYYTNNTLKLR